MANWQVLCSMVLWLNKQTRCCHTICGHIIANLDIFIWQRLYICLMQCCLLLWWFIFVIDQRINMMGGIVDRNINTMNTLATVFMLRKRNLSRPLSLNPFKSVNWGDAIRLWCDSTCLTYSSDLTCSLDFLMTVTWDLLDLKTWQLLVTYRCVTKGI